MKRSIVPKLVGQVRVERYNPEEAHEEYLEALTKNILKKKKGEYWEEEVVYPEMGNNRRDRHAHQIA